MKNNRRIFIVLIGCFFLFLNCSKKSSAGGGSTNPQTPSNPQPPKTNEVDFWLTTGDRSALLVKQNDILSFGTTANIYANIEVDSTQSYQTIDGFGYTLTDGSVTVINALSESVKANLLKELFGNSDNSIGVSYLRLSIGASDLSAETYSYDDVPDGETDVNLDHFSLSKAKAGLIPLLKEILAINPSLKLLGSPWSAPVWMKDNNNFKGGSLLPQYYDAYSKYFVKYIQQMKAEGIVLDAITIQNEPLHGGNNPSMVMTAAQQATFIKNNLGPTFKNASIATKIILYDHNCDKPDYPIEILNDPDARQYVDGSAFHLYGGDISALSTVHNAFPSKNVYFTEQWTSSDGSFDGDLKWHVKNVVIGSMRNWSRVALEWNLANDAGYGPHTEGGCTMCKGALTINGNSISRNVAYYIIAHASKFVPASSVRIASNVSGNINTVAFLTPTGKKVLIVENDGAAVTFNIKFKNKWVVSSLAAGAVGTYVW
ncbi:MAG: glycoside hydrolase family 30 beta sandwich domain-containing protein [Ginsengibacter sp.]